MRTKYHLNLLLNTDYRRDAILIIAFIYLISGGSRSSKGQDIDEQLWMDYNYTVPLSEKFLLVGNAGIRGLISNVDWNQFIVRPGARYMMNESFNISSSLALFSTFNKDLPNVHEFRFTLDFNAEGPDLLYVIPLYRLRFENRSFFYDSIPNENRWRGRLLVGLESMDIKTFREDRFIYLQGFWEGFQTLDQEEAPEFFVNRARVHAVFGHKLSRKFRYEIQYIWQRSRQFEGDDLQSTQNVIRLRVYHRMGSAKK